MSSPSAATSEPPSYRGYRYPVEVISHAVWLYFRFHLSLRDVEELLAEHGINVTYETIRAWCGKFGPNYAAGLRRRRARPADKWHLDEVQLKIKGQRHCITNPSNHRSGACIHAAAAVSWETLERSAVRMAVVAMRPALVRW